MVAGFWRSVTPFGRTVGAVGIVCWLLAAVFGWEEFAILAVACLAALLIGVVFLLVGSTSLAVLLNLTTPRVVAGDAAATTVEATTTTTVEATTTTAAPTTTVDPGSSSSSPDLTGSTTTTSEVTGYVPGAAPVGEPSCG